MEFIVKRELALLNGQNQIEFLFGVYLDKKMQSFTNFDITNQQNKVNQICSILCNNLNVLNTIYPMYTSLSLYFFIQLPELKQVIYKYDNMEYRCNRRNFSKKQIQKFSKILSKIELELV